jgi:hypothetical protein
MARTKAVVDESIEPAIRQSRGRGPTANLHMVVALSLDVRLTAQAKAQQTPKNRFAEKLLDQALSKYATDKVIKAAFEQDNRQAEAAA